MVPEYRSLLTTPIGAILLTERDDCLVDVAILAIGGAVPDRVADGSPLLTAARIQLEEYFAGRRKVFDLPLALPRRTVFAATVLDLLRHVPYGETLTYGELAAQAGSPRGARAVGRVMATNPLPIVIPCHRVIAGGGIIGGYSGGNGLRTKRWLLDFERSHR